MRCILCLFLDMCNEEGGRENAFCICFTDFESERMNGGDGQNLFPFFTQMKRFVLITCKIITFYQNTLVHEFYYNIQN